MSAIAERIGVTKEAARQWMHGAAPGQAARAKLLAVFEVPIGSWEAAAPDVSTSAASPSEPAGELLAPDRLRAILRRIDRELSTDPPPSARVRLELSKHEATVSRQLGELEPIDRRRILASPCWARLSSDMVEALAPWPDALAALADAMHAGDERIQASR